MKINLRHTNASWTKLPYNARLTFLTLVYIVVAGILFLTLLSRPGQYLQRSAYALTSVTVDSAISISTRKHNGTQPTTVFISNQLGYTFYVDSNDACVYSKTTNGGNSWSGALTVDTQTDCASIGIWYDRWTPGDMDGTYIHILTKDTSADDLWYNRLDTATDNLLFGTNPVAITPNKTNTFSNYANYPALTKSTSGVLYVGVRDVIINYDKSYIIKCAGSCNIASNWSDAGTAPLDGQKGDILLLMPLSNGNIMAIRTDSSADDVQSVIYTASTNEWGSWVTIDSNADDNTVYGGRMGATVNPSNGNIYLVYAAGVSSLGSDGDIRTAVFDGVSWTIKTDVLTNTGMGITGAKIAQDSLSRNIYVLYSARITPGTASSANVYWKKSADGMSSWEAEQGPVNAASDDIYGARLNILSDERIYTTWYGASPDYLFGDTIADLLPGIPSLDSPANGASGISLSPVFRVTGTDPNGKDLHYKIQIATDSNFTQNVQTFDQTQVAKNNQIGWVGQNAIASSAYTSGTQGEYVIMNTLQPNTTYYYRGYVINVDGVSSGTQATPPSFTTGGAGSGFYVSANDPSCGDSKSGSETAPWCTVGKAASTLTAAQTVYIKHGTYREKVTPTNSGLSGSVITYVEYGNHYVYISGTNKTNSWALHSGNVYKTTITGGTNALYQNGRLLTKVSSTPTAEGQFYSDSASSAVYVYVYNLDNQGYDPTDTYTMENVVRNYAVELTGQDYTTWIGLSFGKTINETFQGQTQSTNTTVTNCLVEYGGRNTGNKDQGMTFIDQSEGVLVDNCIFRYNEWNGIALSNGSSGTVRNSVSYDNGHNGFDAKKGDSSSTTTVTFENLTTYNNGFITSSSASGIYLQEATDSIIRKSHVSNNGNSAGGAGIKVDGSTGSVVYNNLVHNNIQYGIAVGVYSGTNTASNNTSVWNNTIYSNGSYGINLNSTKNNNVRNNILSENTTYQLWANSAAAGSIGTLVDYNLYYQPLGGNIIYWGGDLYSTVSAFNSATGYEAHSVQSDPLFVNKVLLDFHLQLTSPAVDTGVSITEVTTDYEGTSRPQGSAYDIGAYERSY